MCWIGRHAAAIALAAAWVFGVAVTVIAVLTQRAIKVLRVPAEDEGVLMLRESDGDRYALLFLVAIALLLVVLAVTSVAAWRAAVLRPPADG